jgi:hypothetical protein
LVHYQSVYGTCPAGMVISAGACTCQAGFGGQAGGVCSLCALGKYKAAVGFGDCIDCPAGKYGSLMNVPAGPPTRCQSCPLLSSTTVAGSSRAQCTCVAGYEGSFFGNVTTQKPFWSSARSSYLPAVPSWRNRKSTWVVIESMVFPSSLQDSRLFLIGGSYRGAWAGIRAAKGSAPVFRVRAGRMDQALEYGNMYDDTAFLDIFDFPRDDRNHSLAIFIVVSQCR